MVSLCLVSYKMNVRLERLVRLEMRVHQNEATRWNSSQPFVTLQNTLHGKNQQEMASTLTHCFNQLNMPYLYSPNFVLPIKAGCPLSTVLPCWKYHLHTATAQRSCNLILYTWWCRLHSLAGPQGRMFPISLPNLGAHIHHSLQCHQSVVVFSHVDRECHSLLK